MYTHCIVGQHLFYQFWPLDEAEGTRVEIVLIAHVVDLFETLDAIEVEMIDSGERREKRGE
jgi:hypothetical protein